jgi:hypothetical protein
MRECAQVVSAARTCRSEGERDSGHSAATHLVPEAVAGEQQQAAGGTGGHKGLGGEGRLQIVVAQRSGHAQHAVQPPARHPPAPAAHRRLPHVRLGCTQHRHTHTHTLSLLPWSEPVSETASVLYLSYL